MTGNEQHPKSGRQLRLFHRLWQKVNVRAWTRRRQTERFVAIPPLPWAQMEGILRGQHGRFRAARKCVGGQGQ
jgi:hypothetical protein